MTRQKLIDAPPPQAEEPPLHIKYRPTTLGEVLGQEGVVESLGRKLKDKGVPHAFLFLGPSGCGKTTLARIVARQLKVSPDNVLEVDAATNTGIDAMRAVTDTLRYKGLGDSPRKMVIIDEAHALSKAAWQSMLKVLEEPPSHVFFALCTTEPGKVPDTIQTRCATYTVKSLSYDALLDLLEHVVKKERLDVTPAVLEVVAKASNGSARRALVSLSMLEGIDNVKDAAALMSQPLETEDIIELCRDLVSGRLSWERVRKVLSDNKDQDAEGIRLVVVNYLTAVLLSPRADTKQAPRLLDALFVFSKPMTNRSEKMAPLLLAFAEVVFGQGK